MPKRIATVASKDHAVEQIAGLVDAFCKEHLNDEYADLCRRLTEKLARKRPSPLVSGKPNTWACGIVRTIGMHSVDQDVTRFEITMHDSRLMREVQGIANGD